MVQSDDHNHPDKDISHDPPRQVMAMHCDRAIPEQRRQCPGIGTRNGRQVHESGEAMVAPVGD